MIYVCIEHREEKRNVTDTQLTNRGGLAGNICQQCKRPMIREDQLSFLDYILSQGYVETRDFRSDCELGASELCMHTHTVTAKPLLLFTKHNCYAYAYIDNGFFLDGCYHRFDDGRISLC